MTVAWTLLWRCHFGNPTPRSSANAHPGPGSDRGFSRPTGSTVSGSCVVPAGPDSGRGCLWRRSCQSPLWWCISCATSSRSGRRAAPSLPTRATPTWTRSLHGLCCSLLSELARSSDGSVERGAPARRMVGGTAALSAFRSGAFALVLIYAGQEFLEGLLAAGHPTGLQGIFGDGGWWRCRRLWRLVRYSRCSFEGAGRRPRWRRGSGVSVPRVCGRLRAPAGRGLFFVPAGPLAGCSPSRAPPLSTVTE